MFDWSLETLFEYMSIKGYETYIHHQNYKLKERENTCLIGV